MDTTKPGHESLEVDDIVIVYVNNKQRAGFFKVIKKEHSAVYKKNKYHVHFRLTEEDPWTVSASIIVIDDSTDMYYTWVKNSTTMEVTKPRYPDGCVCKKCNSRNRWAAPNQKDGTSYICYECR